MSGRQTQPLRAGHQFMLLPERLPCPVVFFLLEMVLREEESRRNQQFGGGIARNNLSPATSAGFPRPGLAPRGRLVLFLRTRCRRRESAAPGPAHRTPARGQIQARPSARPAGERAARLGAGPAGGHGAHALGRASASSLPGQCARAGPRTQQALSECAVKGQTSHRDLPASQQPAGQTPPPPLPSASPETHCHPGSGAVTRIRDGVGLGETAHGWHPAPDHGALTSSGRTRAQTRAQPGGTHWPRGRLHFHSLKANKLKTGSLDSTEHAPTRVCGRASPGEGVPTAEERSICRGRCGSPAYLDPHQGARQTA